MKKVGRGKVMRGLGADPLGRLVTKKGSKICSASEDVSSDGLWGSGRAGQGRGGGETSSHLRVAETRHGRTDARRSVIRDTTRCGDSLVTPAFGGGHGDRRCLSLFPRTRCPTNPDQFPAGRLLQLFNSVRPRPSTDASDSFLSSTYRLPSL